MPQSAISLLLNGVSAMVKIDTANGSLFLPYFEGQVGEPAVLVGESPANPNPAPEWLSAAQGQVEEEWERFGFRRSGGLAALCDLDNVVGRGLLHPGGADTDEPGFLAELLQILRSVVAEASLETAGHFR